MLGRSPISLKRQFRRSNRPMLSLLLIFDFRHAAGEPSHSHGDASHGHGGSPKRAVEQVRSWNQEDLDVPQAGRGWIDSAFAHGRDDRPRQEIQQQTSGDAPAHCRCSQPEGNEERLSWCKASFRCHYSVAVDTKFASASHFFPERPALHPRLHGLID